MLTCHLMGGLGNQLFQIFATISYAIKTRKQFKFLNIEKLEEGNATIRYTYWNTFFSNLKPFLITELPKNIKKIKEHNFAYNELDSRQFSNEDDILIYGYFQSYKYFQEYYTMIIRIINLEKQKNELKTKLSLKANYFKDKISMHFRIGDYKKLPHIYPLASYEYYEQSIKQIIDKTEEKKFTILYFCEEDDIEDVIVIINKLKDVYLNCQFIRGEKEVNDWEQLLLMSLCSHNIIANSSFSWWSAYFNSNSDKIVCYPSAWFGEACKHDTKDLCSPEWIKINV